MHGKKPVIWTPKAYDRFAKYYDRLVKTLYPIGDVGRKKVAGRLKNGSVLDVGCGTGALLVMAREKQLDCHGIDTSQGMLDQAQAKVPEATLIKTSFYDIPFEDGRFDYVVATNAISGVSIDAPRVISEMIRVCREGGEVIWAEWPVPLTMTFFERLLIFLAGLFGDQPKDYETICQELGYEMQREVISKRYHLMWTRK